MVLYFTPVGADETKHSLYMGRDKVENEDLIKWGLPEDVWFHVDKLSSAHVYLRVARGESMDDIREDELEDCAQLVKANSIVGNKENNVGVVYTPWSNLKKLPRMEVGQVGFHDLKLVRRVKVATRKNEIVNRLNKTKTESFPDLAMERDEYDREIREEKKAAYREQEFRRVEEERERAADREARSYDRIMDTDAMVSNKDNAQKYASVEEAEDDFM
ncbi:uncharacterized protein MICPUCDRAFT_16406 [Micromonas pusilla CCMP1545]|uniref:Predicted protein n=1 Tax=Micromonas pusilla (strain CCMP1545) TaxID=564608 RepID=C1MQM3_MICPC|nr:uncharacterized protein MICPUCDRAFT_16406 [Micromonas pusilla CCMP1545]EEH57735.1 predicted protein [Micromonas pusilla CCMP1545]|tara:strand:+ start:1131 stop:1781 length:651 start_codon:yes stop_codon:yes gene_type:complete|eukprot:XP_003057784.1 predicted protein [Micromonas pusilla CCMP1545]